jgi:hypothetical protein
MENRGVRAGLSISSAAAALVLWLWQGDHLALAAIGYVPIVVVRLVTGHTEGLTASALWSWEVIRSFMVVLGGLALLYVSARSWPGRRLASRLSPAQLHWTTVALVGVAVAVPVGYAVTRLAWALGIPLGVTDAFLTELRPIVYHGLGLALLALGGAVLTVGLLRPWGEVFPRWMAVLGGRRVPVRFAVGWALSVSVLVMVAGLFFVREMLTGSGLAGAPSAADQQPAAWLPVMFWPLWSLALAGAALCYRERRTRAEFPGAPDVAAPDRRSHRVAG